MKIVESDQIKKGKRIKIGNIIIIGTAFTNIMSHAI